MIRALSLDLFDTLVDLAMDGLPRIELHGREIPSTAGALHAAVAEAAPVSLEDFVAALREVDRSHRDLRYREGVEVSTTRRFEELLDRLGVAERSLVARLTDLHMGMLQAQVSVPEHHAALLLELRARVPVGLCSNFTHAPTARRILEQSGLAEPLEAVVISDELGLRKPRAEIFAAVVEGLGHPPDQTLHVGDNLEADVSGAAAAGLRTAWLTRRVPEPEAALRRHRGPAPDWVVRDLGELLELLPEAG